MSDASEALLRRQRVLADFGDLALRSDDLDQILAEACRLVAGALGTGRAKLLEIEPGGGSLFVRAGVGWAPSVVGRMRIPMGENSSEAFSIKAGVPVITQDISQEDRFELPGFLKDAGVVALANVPVFLPGKRAYGLLQVDDTTPRDFNEADTEFLRTYSTILGPVIDRLLKVRELRSAEERFRLTVGAATDYAILVTDAEYRIASWLPGAAAVFGWSAEEVMGQPSAILFTPEDRKAGEPEKERDAARREGHAPDVRWHQRRDGSRVFIEGTVRALHDPDGTPSGFLKVGQDVTERRATEEALRRSEALFRQFAEASTDVIWIRDAGSLRFDYVSPAFEAIYGDAFERVFAKNDLRRWARLILPEDRGSALDAFRRVREGEPVTHEFRIRRPSDGAVRWIRDTDFPLRDEAGRVERVAGIGQDVTELKRAEAELRASEDRLRTLMEGIPQLVWRSRDRGEWTWASPQWLAFTGQSQEQSHGQGWLDAIHPDDRTRARQAWGEASSRGMLDVELRVRRASDGAHVWHHARSVPTRDGEGRTVEWLGTTTDVQALKELQARQEVMVAELQHRTRNLITVVRSIARQTMASTGPNPAFSEAFDSRLEALSRVQGLLSRAEQEPITLRALLELELEALGATEGERAVLEGPSVRLRPTIVQTLALALHELGTNARKYGALSEGGGRLGVRWRLRNGDKGRRVHIEWREEDLSRPAEADRSSLAPQGGYGRRLIEQALPYALRAETTYDLGPTELRCTIDLPLDRPRSTRSNSGSS